MVPQEEDQVLLYMYIHSLWSACRLPGSLLEEGQAPPLLVIEFIQLGVSQNLMNNGELLCLQQVDSLL